MKAADVFDDWARRGRAEGMEAGHGQTAGPLIASLPLTPGKAFLDLGCGNGWAARHAARHECTAHGIDASKEMVERAQAAADKDSLDATFRQGDFAHLPFDDATFDVVWSMEAVYYAEDPDAVLREVARVMRPGGVFHMLIDFYAENEASHSWPTDLDVHMSLRSEAEWRAAFEAAGLTNVGSERLLAKEGDEWKRTQGTLHVHGSK